MIDRRGGVLREGDGKGEPSTGEDSFDIQETCGPWEDDTIVPNIDVHGLIVTIE